VRIIRASEPVNKRIHIGGGVFVSVSNDYRCVDIRRFWRPKDEPAETATRNGLSIRLTEFDAFVKCVEELGKMEPSIVLPDLIHANRIDHSNQMAMIECIECNPFDNFLLTFIP